MNHEEYHKNRELALKWWEELNFTAQVNFSRDWQKQLGTDFMKGWHFNAITNSDSAKTRIYEWHLSLKQKSIDPDLITDKKY